MIGTSYVMGDRIGRGAASDEFISRKQRDKKTTFGRTWEASW